MPELSALHFLRPAWLWVMPVALLLWWLHLRQHRIEAQWRDLIAPHLLTHLVVRPTRRLAPTPHDWLLALLLLGSLTVAGPSWEREPAPFSNDTGRLVIVLDLAPGMLGPDVAPTRLARAKLKLRDLLAQRRDNRMALIAFAGSAHGVLPFTDDVSAIERTIDILEPRLMPTTADASDSARVARALALAQALLERDGDSSPASILLVSGRAVEGVDSPLHPVLWQFAPVQSPTPAWLDDHIALSTDRQDVEAVHQALGRQWRQAEAALADADAPSRRWRDGGIWLLPLLLVLALPGARRGWSAGR